MTMALKSWRAKRAGGRITVYGTDIATGKEAKITKVDVIVPAADRCIATTADGKKHDLYPY